MKNKITSTFIMAIAIFSLSTSCGSSNNTPTPNTCAQASQLATAAANAAQAYSTNPTPANCQAAKKAYTDFFNAAKGCSANYTKTDLDAAQKIIDTLC